MPNYSEQEEKALNNQLKRWKQRQLTAIKGNKVDEAFDAMNDIDRAVWEKIANADNHKDVNWLVWDNAERVIAKYCKMAR